AGPEEEQSSKEDLPLPDPKEAVPFRREICFFERGGEATVVCRVGN
ncbi:unnamed protein product, partial [Brassica rapa]